MRIVTLLVVLLVLSGCSQLGGQPPTATETETPDIDRSDQTLTATAPQDGASSTASTPATATDAPASSGPGVEETSTGPAPTESTGTARPAANVDTETIQLTLSELPDGFSIAGDTVQHRDQATGETYTQMVDRGVQVLHERAFSAEDGSQQTYVFASVAVYDTGADASGWLDSHLGQIENSGGTVSERDVAQSATATAARFQNDQGLRTVGLYQRQQNVVFYVAVSGDEYDDETAEELFVAMLDDFGNT
ncbi:hypothetical protein IL252_05970 [Halomicrobium sp. IBSBa]|uniref:hypothetical protein n=1 Tax=Halomicrobium sp. IBSBa TaxID=2778916 RepID=UPI001ABF4527|nr:hypothetical protein [Halomicrobium sp. IBSBa]MBO4247368.1 hypothetical protein [Halomicrobium sp. IBSBa]